MQTVSQVILCSYLMTHLWSLSFLSSRSLPVHHSGSHLCSAAGSDHHLHSETSRSVPPYFLNQVRLQCGWMGGNVQARIAKLVDGRPVRWTVGQSMWWWSLVLSTVINRSCSLMQMSTHLSTRWASLRAQNWARPKESMGDHWGFDWRDSPPLSWWHHVVPVIELTGFHGGVVVSVTWIMLWSQCYGGGPL